PDRHRRRPARGSRDVRTDHHRDPSGPDRRPGRRGRRDQTGAHERTRGLMRVGRQDTTWQGVTRSELGQAARNHGMQLEGLRYDVTPVGMHYLVIHFDIPPADEASWTVAVDGLR